MAVADCFVTKLFNDLSKHTDSVQKQTVDGVINEEPFAWPVPVLAFVSDI